MQPFRRYHRGIKSNNVYSIFLSTFSTNSTNAPIENDGTGLPIAEEPPRDYEAESLIGPKLFQLATKSYKSLESFPEWFTEKRKLVGLMRTNKQKRLCANELLEKIPTLDKERQLKYRNRPLGWNYNSMDSTSVSVGYGPSEAIVYADLFMPRRFIVTKRITDEIKRLLPTFHPKRVLDFGCGPATAYGAVLETWGGKQSERGMHKYTGIDSSQAMLDAAKLVTQNGPVDCVFWSKSADVLSLAKEKGEHRYDLIIVSYTLTEMPNDSMRAASMQLLTELLAVGGIIVVIEPGNPQGSHTVRSARQFVLDIFNISKEEKQKPKTPVKKANKDEDEDTQDDDQSKTNRDKPMLRFLTPIRGVPQQDKKASTQRAQFVLPPPPVANSSKSFGHFDFGVKVLAPCLHDGLCPLGEGQWCKFAVKTADQTTDKYSYVVLQRTFSEAASTKVSSSGARNLSDDWFTSHLPTPTYTRSRSADSGGEPVRTDPNPLEVLRRFQELEKQVDTFNDDIEKGIISPRAVRMWGLKVDDPQEALEMLRKAGVDPDSELDADSSMNDMSEEELMDATNYGQYEDGPRSKPSIDDSEEEEEYIDVRRVKHPLLQTFLNELTAEIDWSSYSPSLHRRDYSRIIRPAVKRHGHVVVDVCHADGALVRHTVSKAQVYPIPGMYTALRKLTWGGLMPAIDSLDGPLSKGGATWLGRLRASWLANEAAGRKNERKRKEKKKAENEKKKNGTNDDETAQMQPQHQSSSSSFMETTTQEIVPSSSPLDHIDAMPSAPVFTRRPPSRLSTASSIRSVRQDAGLEEDEAKSSRPRRAAPSRLNKQQ